MADDHRSSTEIERDLAATRARMDENLSELEERLSPGQMFDEALGYLKKTGASDHASAFGRNLARTARDNPVPLALVGIGLTWLMVGGGREREASKAYVRDYRDPGDGGESGVARDGWTAERRPFGPGGGVAHARYEGGPFGRYEEGYHPDDDPDLEDLSQRAYDAEAALIREEDEEDHAWEERKLRAKASVLRLQDQAGETAGGLKARVDAAIEEARRRYEAAKARYEAWRRDSASHDERRTYPPYGGRQGPSYGERLSGYGRRMGATASGYQQRMGETMSDLRRRAGESAAEYRARMDAAVADYRRRASYYGDRARFEYERGLRQAGAYADYASERVGDLFERQPLLMGALGVTAGAVLAAVLPMSRREREVMGPYRDELYRETQQLAEEYRARAQRAGEAALHAARETAEEEGLTPSRAREGAKEAARDFGDRLRHVAEEARDAGRSELEGETSSTGSTTTPGSSGLGTSTGSTGTTSG